MTDDVQQTDDPLSFHPEHASPLEQLENAEFFTSKRLEKTPARYVAIRNAILKQWEVTRPTYLTKREMREILKGHGDVNAIGRVHSFLERVGAINLGCEVKPRQKTISKVSKTLNNASPDGFTPINRFSRKRKVRNENGDWVDPLELQGQVVDHQNLNELNIMLQEQERNYKEIRLIKKQRGSEFDLIDLKQYDPLINSFPFKVVITKDALVIADFHSQLSSTEIIGLLGGKFDDGKCTLYIESSFPCKAISSCGYECEMDPESEIDAREYFNLKGLFAVGWYHSHPSFPPIPSIRDALNQENYQLLVQSDSDGIEPFVGLIIAPYQEVLSQIKLFNVGNECNHERHYRVPFELEPIVSDNKIMTESIDVLHRLVQEYSLFKNRLDLGEEINISGTDTKISRATYVRNNLNNYINDDQLVNSIMSELSTWVLES